MALKLGLAAKLYFKTGGIAGGGAFTELTNVKDVTLTLETGEADVTTRANAGWKATIATLKAATVEFEMVWNTGDAGFGAIKTAFFTNAPIGFAIMDGGIAVSGSQGLHADFSITQFTRTEPLEEAIGVKVQAKVTYSATAPSWEEVS